MSYRNDLAREPNALQPTHQSARPPRSPEEVYTASLASTASQASHPELQLVGRVLANRPRRRVFAGDADGV